MVALYSPRRRLAGAMAAVGLVAAVLVAQATVAFADAGTKASCVGIEASDVSPPGTSDEFAGGVPELLGEVDAAAEALGVPRGAVFSFFAKLHEGSHEACDAVG